MTSDTYCQYGPCPDGSTAGFSGGGVTRVTRGVGV